MAQASPWALDGSSLSIVGNDDLTQIPTEIGDQYGDIVTELKICFCPGLTSVQNLSKFQKLTSLVLDNNSITDQNDFPPITSLTTLWLNNNQMTRLDYIVGDLAQKYPSLVYLSMLKNPCCPNPLVGKNSTDYKKYRLTVIASFPHLKFLDSSPVTRDEREAAMAEFRKVKRADPSEYQKVVLPHTVPPEQSLQNVNIPRDDGAAFGKTRLLSYGNHSEGNRFITDL